MPCGKVLLALLVAGAACATGVARAEAARMIGCALDPNEAAIPNLAMTIKDVRGGSEIEVRTDTRGCFTHTLPAGIYSVRVPGDGSFLPDQRGFVEVGRSREVRFVVLPVPRAGVASTIQGDVRLPDVRLRYEASDGGRKEWCGSDARNVFRVGFDMRVRILLSCSTH